MKWFGGRSKQNQMIGVDFTAEGVAFAHIQRPAMRQPLVVTSEFIAASSPQEAAHGLKVRLGKLGLSRVACNWVMPPSNYQLLLGEAPKVPQEELAEALRWRVKDMVQFPVADAIIDAFLLPEDSSRGASRMAYAVVAQRSTITQIVDQAKLAQLELNAIDIQEMALRNLLQTCADTKRGVALVKLVQGGGSLQIIRDGNLYLSRQFNLAYNAGLMDDIPSDALALEVQRSLDYFERQMRQSPPSTVFLCGENVTADKITQDLRNNLSVSIELLNLEAGMQLGAGVDDAQLTQCLLAIGAALREDTVGAK